MGKIHNKIPIARNTHSYLQDNLARLSIQFHLPTPLLLLTYLVEYTDRGILA